VQKKILVTGGIGYIGSHTCVSLLENNFDVLIVDNLSNSELRILDRIKSITGRAPAFTELELTDKSSTQKYFAENADIYAVIHFAALKAVGESTEIPLKYYENNITGLINLLQAMESINCNRLVFSSSCTVYGQPDELPVTEDSPIKTANSPYGNTKQISEEIISDHCRVSRLNSIILRYFNPIGAHETALIGELPLGVPNNLVPYLTQTAIGLRDSLKVFGGDYPTRDGTGIRDYIHVVDLAEAHLYALKYMEQDAAGKSYEVFNVGTGTGYSVLDIINAFEQVSGVKLNYEIVDRRPGDIDQVWADPGKANRVLGWKARHDLNDMLLSAWKWEKGNML
jgi:UDP-glucose 4-epimerase